MASQSYDSRVSNMGAGNQCMGFTTAKCGLKPVDGRHGIVAGQTGKNFLQHHFQTVRRVCGFGKKLCCIRVHGMHVRALVLIESQHVTDGCSEYFRVECAVKNVMPRSTGVEYRKH